MGCFYAAGLSPHGRGKPTVLIPPQPGFRSIPARAGETVLRATLPWGGFVYPRTGGGNWLLVATGGAPAGLSPHGRGKPVVLLVMRAGTGSIPARAGETPPGISPNSSCPVYPRTGGGNWDASTHRRSGGGLSPHGRGKHIASMSVCATLGSIPARAGETNKCPLRGFASKVYPRTGGGNWMWLLGEYPDAGLSPHGRGKRVPIGGDAVGIGSIPARAGETTFALSLWL